MKGDSVNIYMLTEIHFAPFKIVNRLYFS